MKSKEDRIMTDKQADKIIQVLERISSQLEELTEAVSNSASMTDMAVSQSTKKIVKAIEGLEP